MGDFEEFEDHVWRGLSLRKHLAGKRRVAELTRQIIRDWPAGDASPEEILLTVRSHDYGFFWTIVLQALLYELVVVILEWWRKKPHNQQLIAQWQEGWRA